MRLLLPIEGYCCRRYRYVVIPNAPINVPPYQSDVELLPPRRFPSVSLEEYVKSTVHSANALVGTCKMGDETDKMAVVDSALKVSPLSIVFVPFCPSPWYAEQLPGFSPVFCSLTACRVEFLGPHATFSPAHGKDKSKSPSSWLLNILCTI